MVGWNRDSMRGFAQAKDLTLGVKLPNYRKPPGAISPLFIWVSEITG